MGLGFVTE